MPATGGFQRIRHRAIKFIRLPPRLQQMGIFIQNFLRAVTGKPDECGVDETILFAAFVTIIASELF